LVTQGLRQYYEEFPEKLGRLLADMERPVAVKPEAERQRLERKAEEEYLRDRGYNEEEVR
jgi:hypothetical protein